MTKDEEKKKEWEKHIWPTKTTLTNKIFFTHSAFFEKKKHVHSHEKILFRWISKFNFLNRKKTTNRTNGTNKKWDKVRESSKRNSATDKEIERKSEKRKDKRGRERKERKEKL